MSIDPASGTPLYQQVAPELRRRIISGELQVGTPFPTHRQLADTYAVSIIIDHQGARRPVGEV